MTTKTRLLIGLAGVLVAAVAAALLMDPAASQLGEASSPWFSVLIVGLPVALIIAAAVTPLLGLAKASAGAVLVAGLTCLVAVVVTVQVTANAVGSSGSSTLLSAELYGAPALSVLVFGGLFLLTASKLIAARGDARGHDEVGGEKRLASTMAPSTH